MKSLVLACLTLLMAAPIATAQERAAAGSLETQMTWSALSSQIEALKTQVGGATARLNKIAECGNTGMLYAPSNTLAVNGCLATSAPISIVTVDSNGGAWASGKASGNTAASEAARTAVCPAGTVIIGGSCDMFRHEDGREIQPRTCKIKGNGFYCNEGNTGDCIAHAVCAKQ